ncbi:MULTISPECIES: sugar phosphate isomerase/epimerase family protein [unclassified Romboutsia]|uniref:sugar phosphate isomerase/epimerase family protein n=1 Tax=unclassified Romboutsia TaxID=2626894 RepID=UPI00082069D9|nr:MULTISPECIES: TIM barrel protein [unclassified Romboutsia]SCH02697.1 fructoselysine 3-epimerase [uncultured Clostridium sp.]
MKFYISQLDENKKIIPIIEKYDVGLEIVQFSNPFILDNKEKFIKEYKNEWGSLLNEIDISIHGPFADLSCGSRDSIIASITKKRFEQGYDVAKQLNAKKIVYHNSYVPKLYTYEEWIYNADKFWNDFFINKDDNIDFYLENVLEYDTVLIKRILENINKKNFSACLDIGHANVYSDVSINDWIEELGSKIGHMHIHNNYGKEDSHLGIDKGNIDVRNIISQVEDKNSDVSISLEIVDTNDLKETLNTLYEEGFIKRRD